MRHLTEFGLGSAMLGRFGDAEELRALGLREGRLACTGGPVGLRPGVTWGDTDLPDCPRCAVLRDAAIATGAVPSGVGGPEDEY